jgi:hypothetical protein
MLNLVEDLDGFLLWCMGVTKLDRVCCRLDAGLGID